MSPALVQARQMDELRRFLTPGRVLAAYRELRDGGHRPGFRQSWALKMALVVGHLYGLDLAGRWVQVVVEAGPGTEEARVLSSGFRQMRRAGLDEVPAETLYGIFSASELQAP